MRHARVAYLGGVHKAVVGDGFLTLDDGRRVDKNEVVWLPPLEPRTAFALGLNYADHAKELDFKPPIEPVVFLKGPRTFIGHLAETRRPADATFMHYECELVIVIGRTASKVKREDAYDYISGYTVANDYVIRDYLENYYRPNLRAKNRDGCTPIGPWLVDAGDIADPMDLSLRTYVNDNLVQFGTTKDMIFSISQIIEYLSSFMTLGAGDIILTGTPRGAVNVNVGDKVVTEIEGIGSLENTIVGDDYFLGKCPDEPE